MEDKTLLDIDNDRILRIKDQLYLQSDNNEPIKITKQYLAIWLAQKLDFEEYLKDV